MEALAGPTPRVQLVGPIIVSTTDLISPDLQNLALGSLVGSKTLQAWLVEVLRPAEVLKKQEILAGETPTDGETVRPVLVTVIEMVIVAVTTTITVSQNSSWET